VRRKAKRSGLVRARGAPQAEIDAPGNSASSVAKLLGTWQPARGFGSMMPRRPIRMREVPAPTWPMSTEVAALPIPGHVVMLGQPERR